MVRKYEVDIQSSELFRSYFAKQTIEVEDDTLEGKELEDYLVEQFFIDPECLDSEFRDTLDIDVEITEIK